jgi:hypothetical protein
MISPCLSNIFLHHVLDEWFESEVRPRLKGGLTLHPAKTRFVDFRNNRPTSLPAARIVHRYTFASETLP